MTQSARGAGGNRRARPDLAHQHWTELFLRGPDRHLAKLNSSPLYISRILTSPADAHSMQARWPGSCAFHHLLWCGAVDTDSGVKKELRGWHQGAFISGQAGRNTVADRFHV